MRPHAKREPIPQIDPALQDRIENWSRWVLDNGPRAQHCGSAEWRFSLPFFKKLDAEASGMRAAEVEEMLRKPQPEKLDADDAWLVEIALASPYLSDRSRAIIRGYYVTQARVQLICRRLELPFRRFDGELAQAARMLASVLRVMDLRDGKN